MDWFADRVLDWFDQHGRKDLPWQQPIDPYRVWVSEIMLQQTQVTTVIPYFERFMDRFPTVGALAEAPLDAVLHQWTGLGYYARARNLHRAAGQVVADHGGRLPLDPARLQALPGIGRSTAAAVAAIAGGQRAAILDGNVKRVLARFHAVAGDPGRSAVQKTLWSHAERHTPIQRVAAYTQAIMDLGATLCTRTRPRCEDCPVAARCQARATDTVDQYPGRKAAKPRPVRAARLFLLQGPDGHFLLERRPDGGIWGGLWTPPERPADTGPQTVCQELGLEPTGSGTRTGAVFRHTFSHFHLDIEPVFLEVRAMAVTDRADLCWYDAAGTAAIGLSAPAARLLAEAAAGPPAETEAPRATGEDPAMRQAPAISNGSEL